MQDKIVRQSVCQLEGWNWKGEVPVEGDSSYVERNFYRLHNVPIKDYELADLSFMIGQNTALEYLVPIALEKLKENLFLEAEDYEGDLLSNLLTINDKPNYWHNHKKEKQQLIELCDNLKERLYELDTTWDIKKGINKEYENFLEKH
jgi:hypothetical protein